MLDKDTNITNYITINRRFFNHSFWGEHREYSKAEAWLDLLQSARFEVSQGSKLIGMSVVKWNRGEIPASIRYLVNRWHWSIGKVTRFLDLLKAEKMITTRQDNGQTIINICNYNLYNYVTGLEQQAEHLKPHPQRVSAESRNTKRNETDTAPIQERYETNKDNTVNTGNKEEENTSGKPPPAPVPKKEKPINILFRNSEIFDKEKFAAALENTKYADADIDYYHEAMLNWSDGKGQKRADWLAVARGFMSRDADEGKYRNKKQQNLFPNGNNQQTTSASNGKNGNHGKSAGAIKLAHSLAADFGFNDE